MKTLHLQALCRLRNSYPRPVGGSVSGSMGSSVAGLLFHLISHKAMARFNPFLGTQVGSVGDVVMYRRNGVQVQRVRIREVKNPRTEAQAKNRAVLATMGAAYSYMQGIVDHSFQNKNSKSANMQEFQRLNQGIARSLDNAPAFDAQNYNYNFKGESVLRPNPYAISRGTLPSVQIVAPAEGAFDDGFQFTPAVGNVLFGSGAAQLTYQQVADLFGVELGSQLTFCIISDDTFTGVPSSENMPKSYGNFHYARVILAPDDGDGTKMFFSISGTNYTINNANSKNQGSVAFDDGVIVVAGKRYPLAAGVIVSNYNGRWLRNNTDIVVAADYVYSNGMAEVFNSYMDQAEEQPASDLYLNQSKAPARTEHGEELLPLYYKSVEAASGERFVCLSDGKIAVVKIGDALKVLNGAAASYSLADYSDVLGEYTIIKELPSTIDFVYLSWTFTRGTVTDTYNSSPSITQLP